MMQIPRGRLAKSTVLAAFFNGMRLLAQAVSLILLARLIGPIEFGNFAGIAGMATVLGSLCGLGTGLVMYQEAANCKSQLGSYWRLTLVTTIVSSVFIAAVGTGLTVWLIDADLKTRVIGAIFLADVIFAPLVAQGAYAMAANERIGWAAAFPCAMSIARLLAVAYFWFSELPRNVESYVLFYLSATIVAAIACLGCVYQVLRPLRSARPVEPGVFRRGLGFMAVWASGMGLTSLDKTIVLRYAGAEAAGLYAPAYRAATLLAFPAESMSMAAMPRLFQKFGDGNRHRGLLRTLVCLTTLYGVAAGALLWFAASLLPVILGDAYTETADAVRWLSLFVPCYSLRKLGGSVLMAANMNRFRAITEAIGLIAMLVIGMLVLPGGGVIAAAIMITVVESGIAVTHWTRIFRLLKQGGGAGADSASATELASTAGQ